MSRQVSRRVVQHGATAPCPACGRQNPAGAVNCWACGALLHAPANPTPPPPSAPPPPDPSVLDIDFSDEDEGPLPLGKYPTNNPILEHDAAVKRGERKPKGSLWTRKLSFGLEGQPSCAAAVRVAIIAGTFFPPLFLVAIIMACMGLARGEPSAAKVLVWMFVAMVVYGVVSVVLVMLIVRMTASLFRV